MPFYHVVPFGKSEHAMFRCYHSLWMLNWLAAGDDFNTQIMGSTKNPWRPHRVPRSGYIFFSPFTPLP